MASWIENEILTNFQSTTESSLIQRIIPMKNILFTTVLWFSLFCDVLTATELRNWTSGKHTVEAELVEVSKDGKSVTLRRSDNGKKVTLPLDKLSEADQNYVRKQKNPPETSRSSAVSGSKDLLIEPASGKGQRRALLIGVNDYESLKPLHYCEADATTLRDALVKLGFHPDDIKLLTSATKIQPTRLNIEEQLDSLFAGLSENDMVLISLSGHGGQFTYRAAGGRTKEESFFCPKDARTKQPDRTMISTQEIYDRLDKCPAKFKLLLIDACRDEHLIPDDDGGRSGDLDESRAIEGFSKSIMDMRLPRGTFALVSCAAKEKSYESSKLKQGVFMYHVVQGSLGKADADGDGIVSLFELRNFVIQQTTSFVFREFDRRKQNPFFHSHFETADFGLFDISILRDHLSREERDESSTKRQNDGVTKIQVDGASLATEAKTKMMSREDGIEMLMDMLEKFPMSIYDMSTSWRYDVDTKKVAIDVDTKIDQKKYTAFAKEFTVLLQKTGGKRNTNSTGIMTAKRRDGEAHILSPWTPTPSTSLSALSNSFPHVAGSDRFLLAIAEQWPNLTRRDQEAKVQFSSYFIPEDVHGMIRPMFGSKKMIIEAVDGDDHVLAADKAEFPMLSCPFGNYRNFFLIFPTLHVNISSSRGLTIAPATSQHKQQVSLDIPQDALEKIKSIQISME